MSGYFELFPREWRTNPTNTYPQLSDCPVCKKPYARSFSLIFGNGQYTMTPLWNGQPMSADFFCQGHISRECEACGWNVPAGYHTQEDCDRLAAIVGKTRKTAIPQAFYEAFAPEEEQP